MNQTDREWLAILNNPRTMTAEEVAQDHEERAWARDHAVYEFEWEEDLEARQTACCAAYPNCEEAE